MNTKTIIFRHILVWSIFIIYETTFLHVTAGFYAPIVTAAIFYGLNISLFYFNAYLILDFSFLRTDYPYLIAIILIILEMAIYLGIKALTDFTLVSFHLLSNNRLTLSRIYWFTNTWRGLYFIGLSIAYWSTRHMLGFKEKNHKIETEQLKTLAKNLELENNFISVENAYLQNQISPHLLFNSLNFIYTTVRGYSEIAGVGIIRLSDLMRYSLVSADDSRTVLLSEEFVQLENLVALCRLRFGSEFYLTIKKKGKIAGVKIIPLILITLVENMMKHGDLGIKTKPAYIFLEVNGDSLLFETRNVKRNTILYTKAGLGLKNIEKRLGNYYKDRYSMTVHEQANDFVVTLILTNI